MPSYEFTVAHLFCGIGGGALGFQRAQETYWGLEGHYRTLGGIDADPQACQDFTRLTGGRPAHVMDLFARDDYTAFHGHEPPDTWHEVTPDDIRHAIGTPPDIWFSSPPCKGISSLLPAAQANTPKYQALNRLTLRGIALILAAWPDHLPGLILLENVPRLASGRGAHLLAAIEHLLTQAGYVIDQTVHDLGEVGGLSQHRRRFLLVARHPAKVPTPLYRPPIRAVRPIKDVLQQLPLPDDPQGGAMHRLPRLNWMTWVRLALIPPGGDWRDLQHIEPGSFGIAAAAEQLNHTFKVTPLDGASGTVTGAHSPSNRAVSVADSRFSGKHWDGHFRVVDWNRSMATVTAQAAHFGSNSAQAVADPRLHHTPRHGVFRIARWTEPVNTIVGSATVNASNGVAAVADPRVPRRGSRRSGQFAVRGWTDHAMTVTGEDSVGSGAQSVADPRLTCTPRSGAYRVLDWKRPATTVTSSGDVHSQGAAAVADPRIPSAHQKGVWIIEAADHTWHRPLTTLELAILQGFPAQFDDGSPLVLAGHSQAQWRERIGNAVPPPAAEAIGRAMLLALIPSRAGLFAWNVMMTSLWVRAMQRWWRRLTPLSARSRP